MVSNRRTHLTKCGVRTNRKTVQLSPSQLSYLAAGRRV
jgi:hypothetical protein